MMKFLLSFCLMLSYSFVMFAHQAEISNTLLVEQEDGSWILHVRSAMTAFEYEVATQFGKDAFATAEAFQELVGKHLTDNISVSFGEGAEAILQSPLVKLGHETSVSFVLKGVPKTFDSIVVRNTSFNDIHQNQSAFILLKKGYPKRQYILNERNKHSVTIELEEISLGKVSDDKGWSTRLPYIVGLGVFLSLLIPFGLKWRRESN